MKPEHSENQTAFLQGGGETGALIAAFDWSKTSLGPIENWPQSLKTATAILLRSPVPMVMLWGKDGFLIYNDGYAVFAGERHPHILGTKAVESWPEIADFNANVLKVVLAGNTLSYKDQELVLNRTGKLEQAWMDLDYVPVLDEGGMPAGVLVIVVETTPKILAERRAQAEREQFLRLFEQAPTFMAMLSGPEHRFDLANPGYFKLIGHRPVLGLTVAEALPDAVEQGFLKLLDDVYTSGKAFSAIGFKYAVQPVSGGPVNDRFVDFVYQPITDKNGEVIGIFVEGVDVTDRVTAERRRESLVKLTDKIRDLTDPEEIGYEAAKVLGNTFAVSRVGFGDIDHENETIVIGRDLNAPGSKSVAGFHDLRKFGSFIDDLKLNDVVSISDVRVDPRTASNKASFDHVGVRALVNVPVVEHGRLVSMLFLNHSEPRDWQPEDLALIREVAERTRTAMERARNEKALREANETLEAKVEARTRALMEAEDALRQSQKMEAVGQLTGGLAHDFNNILAGISGSLEMMQTRIVQGRIHEVDRYTNAAQSATKRASALTQRLLAFSRRQTLDPRPINVNRLVADMQDLIQRSVGPSIELEAAAASGLWTAFVDAGQLENALLNLCINARDAMPNGGKLTVETANRWLDQRAAKERELPEGQYISLCVSDNGTGMPPEVIARAFDPFYTTKPIGQGTGLGLSMVHGFAGQSGGTARIYSEVGKGTMVCIYLPRHLGEAKEAEVENTPFEAPRAGGNETVLVVDDEPLVRMLIVEQLEELGYSVLEAGDGPSGLKILNSNAPLSLLITDVGLPGGMNGRQMADAARVSRPELKVLFITGYAENAVLNHGHLEAGMQVMTKPFSLDTLAARISHLAGNG